MPIFEFRCVECGDIFEKLLLNSNEEADMSCPNCRSESLERVVSRSSYIMGAKSAGARPKITTQSCGQSNQCMTLDLPGPSK